VVFSDVLVGKAFDLAGEKIFHGNRQATDRFSDLRAFCDENANWKVTSSGQLWEGGLPVSDSLRSCDIVEGSGSSRASSLRGVFYIVRNRTKGYLCCHR